MFKKSEKRKFDKNLSSKGKCDHGPQLLGGLLHKTMVVPCRIFHLALVGSPVDKKKKRLGKDNFCLFEKRKTQTAQKLDDMTFIFFFPGFMTSIGGSRMIFPDVEALSWSDGTFFTPLGFGGSSSVGLFPLYPIRIPDDLECSTACGD